MRLPLTEQQREHLRDVREAQLAEWRAGRPQVVDAMFIEEEVVRLMSRMGRAVYLGLDGRVWAGNLGEGESPGALEDPKDVASCIVRWARTVGLPELIEVLPPMPEGGEVCALCGGERETHEGIIPRGEDGVRRYCPRCGGLGWTTSARTEAAVAGIDGSPEDRRSAGGG